MALVKKRKTFWFRCALIFVLFVVNGIKERKKQLSLLFVDIIRDFILSRKYQGRI